MSCAESTTSPQDFLEESAPEVVETFEPDPAAEIEVIPDTPRDETVEMPGDPDIVDIPAEEGSATSTIGGPCETNEDCVAPVGLTPQCMTNLFTFVFPGGICTAVCTEAGQCGPMAECVDLSIIRYCLLKCSTATECRVDEGYICDIIPYITDTNTYCIPQF
jgi:hypothetical protein